VDDKCIESKSQSLSRNTTFDDKDKPEQRAKKQFHFEQSWEVSVSPTNAAGIIRVAIAAGANASGQIDWRLGDRKALQAQAAANALVKARAVASQMAEGLHVKLGALIYASNETPDSRIYFHKSLETVEVNASAASVMSLRRLRNRVGQACPEPLSYDPTDLANACLFC